MVENRDYCNSSYLCFRYVVKENYGWGSEAIPKYPDVKKMDQFAVSDYKQISDFLQSYIKDYFDDRTGILLSGGIDSAIIASYLPVGTKTYTIKFNAENALDESIMAKKYATEYNLENRVIEVDWNDYIQYAPMLMEAKKAPLHAVEVALFKAGKTARNDGIEKLITGIGADSTFGGMDKLLSKDWLYNEFVNRYTFVDQHSVLKNAISMDEIFRNYKIGEGIDFISFLKEVHGKGIIQAFDNALHAANIISLEPYESMRLEGELDLKRIRNGESKYMLRELFMERYPRINIPEKIPFARPMDQWLAAWDGPKRQEFLLKQRIDSYSGDQKWLLYSLENFLDIMN